MHARMGMAFCRLPACLACLPKELSAPHIPQHTYHNTHTRQKHTASKKQQAALKAVKGIGGSSGATSGMASSLVFTPTQGLELHNPLAQEEKRRKLEEANKKWFDSASGFMSARPK